MWLTLLDSSGAMIVHDAKTCRTWLTLPDSCRAIVV